MCDLAAISRSVGTQPRCTSYVAALRRPCCQGPSLSRRSASGWTWTSDSSAISAHTVLPASSGSTPQRAGQGGDQREPASGHRVDARTRLDRYGAARVVDLDPDGVGHRQHPYEHGVLTVQQGVGHQLGDRELGVGAGRVPLQDLAVNRRARGTASGSSPRPSWAAVVMANIVPSTCVENRGFGQSRREFAHAYGAPPGLRKGPRTRSERQLTEFCASWMACCGNQAPAAGSAMPQSGSLFACCVASQPHGL